MEMDAQHQQILEELQKLNKKASRQTSVWFIFLTGIIYGVGFVVGSAILATIALGVFGPIVGSIPWIQDSFTRGAELLGR